MSTCPRVELKIAKAFSKAPGPRFTAEGDFSGEEFRKTVLEPAFRKAVDGQYILHVDMDGAAGYGTSFLEESFGGLIREHGFTLAVVRAHLLVKSDDEPEWLDEIEEYLTKAEQERVAK
jgi:hypothetical protein